MWSHVFFGHVYINFVMTDLTESLMVQWWRSHCQSSLTVYGDILDRLALIPVINWQTQKLQTKTHRRAKPVTRRLLQLVIAVAERPRDALCPSVHSFNSVIPRAQSVLLLFQLQIYHCVQCSVVSGVTLRLLVIYTSSSYPVVSHEPPLTSD